MEDGISDLTLRVELLHPDYLLDLILADEAVSFSVERISSGDVLVSQLPTNKSSLQAPSLDHSHLEKSRKNEKAVGRKTKKPDKLRYILEEMLHFEHRLLESLRILTEITSSIYEKNSCKEATMLREIFKDIPSLYQLHQHLSSGLDSLRPNGGSEILPSVFINSKEIPYLNIYKSFMCRYAANFPKLSNIILKDKEFRSMCAQHINSSKYEEQRIQDVCGMYLGVHSSVTRFKLLISKIEETLTEDDARIGDVRKALKVLDELLVHSEGEIVRQDRILEAHVAFSQIDGRKTEFQQIPPLIKQGPCKKIPRRSALKRNLDRHLFLFSDYLVITMPANTLGRYQVKSEVMLNGMKLLEIEEDDDIETPYCFRIKAKELCVELAFSSETEKTEWWDQLQSAIKQEVRQSNTLSTNLNAPDQNSDSLSGSSAIEWVKDEQSTMCAECSVEFSVFVRRHHCRACGKVFCGTCSDYRAPIAYQGGKERVCVIDYYLINSHLKPPTPEIVEGILRRTQQESSATQTGHLLWCRYNNGMWDLKQLSRSIKTNSQSNFVTIHPRLVTVTGLGEKSRRSSIDQSSNGHLKLEDGALNHPENKEPVSPNDLTLSPMSSTLLKSVQSKRSTSPQHGACLSRVFCALGKDTLLSIYAARADIRAKDRLPLIGTRLLYLDYACSNADSTKPTPSATLSRFFSLRQKSRSQIPADSTSSAPTTPSRKLSVVLDGEHCSKLANPIYRNSKPPPLAPKPKLSVIAAALKITDQSLVCTEEHKENHFSANGNSMKTLPNLRRRKQSNQMTSFGSDPSIKAKPTLTQEDVAKQIASVSPIVLALLRNRLGFILLPMNNDCLAHYFEAPSIEIRTRWINSIRRTCIDYLEN